MSIFTIGDLHLSLDADKSMELFSGWEDYICRLHDNWNQTVKEGDTVVVAGDISWSMDLKGAEKDFDFLNSLNGQKILLKGNHDYWWQTRKKMDEWVKANSFDTISFMFNDAHSAEGTALCGTRGWFFEESSDGDSLVYSREIGRLRTSVKAALDLGCGETIAFLHYPPIYGRFCAEEIVGILKEANIKKCFYGHIHSTGAANAVNREIDGVFYRLISADYLGFRPYKVK
ncbi:MAG: metallophosphoesterase [Oscillospiraceae bacterium]